MLIFASQFASSLFFFRVCICRKSSLCSHQRRASYLSFFSEPPSFFSASFSWIQVEVCTSPKPLDCACKLVVFFFQPLFLHYAIFSVLLTARSRAFPQVCSDTSWPFLISLSFPFVFFLGEILPSPDWQAIFRGVCQMVTPVFTPNTVYFNFQKVASCPSPVVNTRMLRVFDSPVFPCPRLLPPLIFPFTSPLRLCWVCIQKFLSLKRLARLAISALDPFRNTVFPICTPTV